jgi:pseudaminic acid synthase
MEIRGRPIGLGQPTYVVAELSANHRGRLDDAMALVDAAADAGADAVKLQTYTADTITIDARNEHFVIDAGTVWDGRTLHDLYAEAATPWEWHAPLKERAEARGLSLFSSPFDPTAVDFLEQLGVPAYKIASFELVDIGLIACAARTGRPLIMSTGMATLDEVGEAVSAARDAGAREIALLKATSAYPAPPDESNLRTIPHLAEAFGVPTGLSDHTIGIGVPVAAVALGACIIEKHLTLSRSAGGPDAAFSTEPDEFRAMVVAIRDAERGLGRVSYEPTANERDSRSLRRSLFVVADVAAGEPFTRENVRSIRPAAGLHTRHLDDVLGRVATRDVERGTPLSWDLVQGG